MTEIKLQVGSPHALRDHLRVAIGHCTPGGTVRHTLEDALAQIEEQVKPEVKEPTAFGSILRANCEPGLRGIFWQKSPMHGKHYWESTGGALALWSELTDVEVLRVGFGEQESADEWRRLDVANAQTEAYTKGAEDFAAKVRREICALRSKVVTGPEMRTCDDLLALVGILQGLAKRPDRR